jgi:hypothetical protein
MFYFSSQLEGSVHDQLAHWFWPCCEEPHGRNAWWTNLVSLPEGKEKNEGAGLPHWYGPQLPKDLPLGLPLNVSTLIVKLGTKRFTYGPPDLNHSKW